MELDPTWNETAVSTPQSLFEPTGMNLEELLQWYGELPRRYRVKHNSRIRELEKKLMCRVVVEIANEIGKT